MNAIHDDAPTLAEITDTVLAVQRHRQESREELAATIERTRGTIDDSRELIRVANALIGNSRELMSILPAIENADSPRS